MLTPLPAVPLPAVPLPAVPSPTTRPIAERTRTPLATPAASPISSAAPPPDAATDRRRNPRAAAAIAVVGAVLIAVLGAVAWRAGARDARLARRLGGVADARTTNGVASEALYARYLVAASHRELVRLPEARREFRALVDDAPLYAPGWAGLSYTLFMSAGDDMSPAEALPAAVEAARQALALDSTLMEPRRTLIAEAMYGRWDLADARRQLDAALARDPHDPELLSLLANWYRWRGEHEASIRLKRQAMAAHPLSPRYANQVVFSLILARRCEEAAEFFRRIGEDYRANAASRLYTYRALKCAGRRDEAAAALRAALLDAGNARDSALATTLQPPLSPARRDAAIHAVFRARLDAWTATRRRQWRSATEPAVDYAEMENADSTLAWLDSMYVERATLLHIVPFDQNFDFMARDPRFRAFIARLPWTPVMGLSASR
jgi:tetratricopeptide (TPR) repeat protein